ncbi:hypothetical protein [Chryseobacterium flavum]|uniref:hypothetical protein n=1 Tax=Chryseobacterium flavum TaxID=415851 RepID=UPI0028A6C11B|nr:hypothetical protein [Chryseobacterium flavum]
MQDLRGGLSKECAWAVAGLAVSFAGLCVTTTPIGGALGVAAMITSGVGMGACN